MGRGGSAICPESQCLPWHNSVTSSDAINVFACSKIPQSTNQTLGKFVNNKNLKKSADPHENSVQL